MNRLKFSGRQTIPGAGPITLQNLSLVGSTFVENSPEDTIIGTFSNTTASSVLALTVANNHLKIVGTSLKVGSLSSGSGATLTPSISETLAGATNTPRTSGPFTITVTPTPSGNRGNFGSSKPLGALDADNAPSGPTNWWNVMSAATPGAVVWLAPGSYGDMDIFNINKAAPGITIQGQAGVTANLIKMTSCSGITFQYIDVLGGNAASDSAGHPMIGFAALANSCDRVGFNNLTITNDLGPVSLVSDPDGFNGSHQGAGIACTYCDNIKINNNLISKRSTGMSCYDIQGGTSDLTASPNQVINNSLTHINVDVIIGNGIRNFVLRSNYLAVLDEPLPTGSHPDSMQLSDTGLDRNGVQMLNSNILVELNQVDNSAGGRTDMQGIALSENIDGFIFRYNCCHGTQTTGTSLSGCSNGQMYDNFQDGWVDAPRVSVRDGSHDISLLRNKFSGGFLIINDHPKFVGDTVLNPYNITMPTTGVDANVTIASATGPTDSTNRDAFLAAMTAAGHIIAGA